MLNRSPSLNHAGLQPRCKPPCYVHGRFADAEYSGTSRQSSSICYSTPFGYSYCLWGVGTVEEGAGEFPVLFMNNSPQTAYGSHRWSTYHARASFRNPTGRRSGQQEAKNWALGQLQVLRQRTCLLPGANTIARCLLRRKYCFANFEDYHERQAM